MKNVIVSACLLGDKCRYDGKSKECETVLKIKERFNLIPVCPEILGEMKTPRAPSEICNGRVISKTGEDNTKYFKAGAEIVLEIAKKNNCRTAILKEKSPSCGFGKVYDGSFSGTLTDGNGVTAQLLLENGIQIFGETEAEKIK